MTDVGPTGENLYTEDNFDYIPGATLFCEVDHNNGDEKEDKVSETAASSSLPSNPMDYLKSVQKEAQQCPDVVVATIDASKLSQKDSISKNISLRSSLAGSEHAPSKVWSARQVKNFGLTRQQFVSHMAKLKSINKQSKRRPKLPVNPLPAFDDEVNWRYFCLGNKLKPINNEADVEDKSEVVMEDENKTDNLSEALANSGSTTNGAEDKTDKPDKVDSLEDRVIDLSTLEEGFEPLLRILLRMGVKQVQLNLSYQVEWLKTYGFSAKQGRWIYGLMTCLEKPLFPTVISTLRDLARQCAQERLKAEPGSEEMNGLNLIICVVADYFGQSDLVSNT